MHIDSNERPGLCLRFSKKIIRKEREKEREGREQEKSTNGKLVKFRISKEYIKSKRNFRSLKTERTGVPKVQQGENFRG